MLVATHIALIFQMCRMKIVVSALTLTWKISDSFRVHTMNIAEKIVSEFVNADGLDLPIGLHLRELVRILRKLLLVE